MESIIMGVYLTPLHFSKNLSPHQADPFLDVSSLLVTGSGCRASPRVVTKVSDVILLILSSKPRTRLLQ